MKWLMLVLFSLKVSASVHSLNEFLIDNTFKKAGHIGLALNYSYQSSDIENESDPTLAIPQIEFTNLLGTIGIEYQPTDRSQVRLIMSASHNYSSAPESEVINDPVFIYWYRYSDNTSDSDKDFGLELSPSLTDNNIYKIKNGHSATIKYRFGLSSDLQSIHATYFLGIKDTASFTQEDKYRKLDTITFWGLSISANQNIYKKLYVGINLRATRLSQNQTEVYFPNEKTSFSWHTAGALLLSYQSSSQQTYTIGYQVQNESSSLNKIETNLDIENESSGIFLSLKQTF